MLTKDCQDEVQCMNGVLPVRLRVFGEKCVLATPVATNGHLLNRNSTWIATHVVSSLNVPTSMRFFVAHFVDTGVGSRLSLSEHILRWVGKVAVDRTRVKMVSASDIEAAAGCQVDFG